MSYPLHPQHHSSVHNLVQEQRHTMGRAFSTPSPAREEWLSSAEDMPRTPSAASGMQFGDRQRTPTRDTAPPDVVVDCPRTPTSKNILTKWHGLPSPETPSGLSDALSVQPTVFFNDDQRSETLVDVHCGECAVDKRPSVSPITSRSASVMSLSRATNPFEEQQAKSVTCVTSVEGDAELAQELSTSLSTRRSTRIRDKVNKQVESRVKTTVNPIKSARLMRPAGGTRGSEPQPSPQPVLTQAEPATSPFEVALSSSMELPILHSTEWQLKYPPGGSAHPAYPWPTADPRLIFHAHYVPLNNGTPDVSHTPDFALPAGWRKVSWSGLHPVVFDPYQQAFKLTPVGALPLTCEEVQQGGLQHYVPNGNLHPEFGLLPSLSSFSDGSDFEIFNFEGVDWTLSWAHIDGDFEDDNTASGSSVGASKAPSTPFDSPSASAVRKASHYIQGRDCPDDVIDLEDGWRWLQEWNPSSKSSFETTPGKSWRGSGIPLSGRAVKQPIASLMALTMTDEDPNVEHYLVKQVKREFCPLKSVATPVHVDIALLKDVEFTIVELLAYFPFHYQWRGAANRLIQSDMTASDVANLINMVRQLPAGSLCIAGTVNGYLFWDRDETGNRVRVESSTNSSTSFTAEHWTNVVWEMTDYPLLGLAVGLQDLPSGADAGPLTSLISWCRTNQRYTTMLSDVPSLLKEAGISSLIDPGEATNPDRESVVSHGEAMKKDRLRVLLELRELKEEKALEAAEGRSFKKRKTQ